MTSLEQIVLPLAESRALVERGIKMDTAMVSFNRGDDSWELVTREWALHVTRLPPFVPDIPRPVLSELLDAIRAKVGNPLEERTIILSQDGHLEVSCCAGVRSPHGEYQIAYNDTDLLAAASLLLEVAK